MSLTKEQMICSFVSLLPIVGDETPNLACALLLSRNPSPENVREEVGVPLSPQEETWLVEQSHWIWASFHPSLLV